MKQGVNATLEAAFRMDCGRLVATVACEGPLELRGPFRQTSAPLFYLRNTTCGVFGADRYRVRVEAQDNTAVHVSSSSAAKAYHARGRASTTLIEIEARPGSDIVWGPHPLILQESSKLSQRLTCTIHPGATVRLADILCFGRVASGEGLAFESYDFELEVRRRGSDEPGYEERFTLRPDMSLKASLGGHLALATVYFFGADPGTQQRTREAVLDTARWAGCSSLPNGIGFVARALTQSLSEAVGFCDSVLRVEGDESEAELMLG